MLWCHGGAVGGVTASQSQSPFSDEHFSDFRIETELKMADFLIS